MLVVNCINCDAPFRCEPALAGEQVACPRCGAHLRIPFDSPDLDAIQKRAAAKAAQMADAQAADTQPHDQAESAQADASELDSSDAQPIASQEPEVLQATVHDMYIQGTRQHAAIAACLETLHQDLALLAQRSRRVSWLLLSVLVLLAAIFLGLLVLTIRVWGLS